MATEQFSGPIGYAVFVSERSADLSAGLRAILDRAGQGLIDLIDIEVIARGSAGEPTKLELTDITCSPAERAALAGIESGILDTEDLNSISAELTDTQLAVAVVYEDLTLSAAAAAWAKVGGTELFSGAIAISDLEVSLEEGDLQ